MNLTSIFVLIISVFLKGHGGVPGIKIPDNRKLEARNLQNLGNELFGNLKSEVQKPDTGVFMKAITGFFNLKACNQIKKNILTIIDFSLSSSLERMWVIDLDNMAIIHRNLVAHGRNSGDEYATSFSNVPHSCKSSLGFYVTGETYYGNHGKSLFLDGAEPGINDKARPRAIVMHGAEYVSHDFVNRYGRLGRSFGCPAIPVEDHEKIITMLAGGSCIYIYSPDKEYLAASGLLNEQTAVREMSGFMQKEDQLYHFISDVDTSSAGR